MSRCRYCGGYAKPPFVYCSHDHALEDGAFDETHDEDCECDRCDERASEERFQDEQDIVRSWR